MIGTGFEVEQPPTAAIGVAPTYCAHDWMSDGMIAAKANQRIAGLHGLSHPLLDEVPWIRGAIELNMAMIFEPASRTDVNS